MDSHKSSIDSAFISIIKCKCPKCHSGKMFKYGIYHPKFMNMPEQCSNCHQVFEIEPGFYWGAMYISYAFTVGISITASILFYYLFNDPPVMDYVYMLGIIFVVLSPIIFRYSRVLMLYLFGGLHYDPSLYKRS